jgi:ribulose-phosphate 3-epimerase
MDGRFVRNLSFGPAMCAALVKRYGLVDAHLMLAEPDVLAQDFVRAGASRVYVHAEAAPQLLLGLLTRLRSDGVEAGLAVAPLTPVEALRFALPFADAVLVMSVTPGFGGQALIEGSLEKARDLVRLREVEGYGYSIGMDGGVNAENARRVAGAGCDLLVAGSALFGAPDPAKYLMEMAEQTRENFVS